jgi:maltooligosyltrehalose synthase
MAEMLLIRTEILPSIDTQYLSRNVTGAWPAQKEHRRRNVGRFQQFAERALSNRSVADFFR